MKRYVVTDEFGALHVVGAIGFVPKNAICEAPEDAGPDDGKFIIIVDGVAVLDTVAKQLETERLLQLELQDKTNQESLAYLASTDWYVIRKQETGIEIPQDILEARAAARAAIVR